LHVEVNGNTPGNVEIMTRVENVEFPPVATSNVGFVADYGDVVASIDAGQIMLAPPREYPPAAITAGTTTLSSSTYGNGAYTASASSIITNYDAFKAFNKTIAANTDAWAGAGTYNTLGTVYAGAATTATTTGTKSGDWLQIQLPSAIALYSYKLTSSSSNILNIPTRWVILGSNNVAGSWDVVDASYENTSFVWSSLSQTISFQVPSNTTAYLYYRMVVLQINGAANGQNAILGEWALFERYSQVASSLEFPPVPFTANSLFVPDGPYYGCGLYTASASSSVGGATENPWNIFDKFIPPTGVAIAWTASSPNVYGGAGGAYNGTFSTSDINGAIYAGEWIQLSLPIRIVPKSYSLVSYYAADRYIIDLSILGSNDGIIWTNIQSISGLGSWGASVTKSYVLTTPVAYSYFRLVVTKAANTYLTISEWRIFGDLTSAYPRFKCTLPASSTTVTNGSTYGAGTYSVYANTISNWTFSNQTTPAALVDKNALIGWQSSSNIYTNLADAPALATPSIYFQLPDVITLNSYTLTARSTTLTEIPSKWNLYGSNLSLAGAGWTTLDSRTAATTQTAAPQSFTPSNVTAAYTPYNLFRFDLLRNASATPAPISLAELKLTGSKTTSERRLVVAGDGRVGINTSVAGLNNDAALTIAGNLSVADINVTGTIGDPILQTGPYVPFDGSTANRDKFLAWMQYVTSYRYRSNFASSLIKTGTWWNTSSKAEVYDSLTYTTVAASGVTGNAYIGGVLLPDGRVVFVPYNATTIGIFNPIANTYSTITTSLVLNSGAYGGGVLLPDGRVVFVPRNVTTIGIFDSATNTFSTIASAIPANNFSFVGGLLLPDGRVLFVPQVSPTIGIFNPTTNTYSTITMSPTPVSNAYFGGVLLPDGRVVFVPQNATTIGIFNPATNTYSIINAGAPGSSAYAGGVLLPDGRVLFVPRYATTIGIFNPATNAYSTIATGALVADTYQGGVLLPDGRVVFVPNNGTSFGIFNPTTNLYSTIAGAPGGAAYTGGTLLPDGRVVFVPANVATVGILNTAQSLRAPPLELCYHPCFNKY
jgi:hypothetical protein